MRVLIIASEAPPIASGVSRCVAELSLGIRARGHDVDVISTADVPRWTIGEFRFTSFASHWPKLAANLPSYDVVNIHGPVPTMSDAFLALIRTIPGMRRPAIVYTHHCAIDIHGFRAACDAYGWVHARLARGADRIVTTSDSYAAELAPHRNRIEVVPWGVDAARRAPAERRRREATDRLRVLFVGQMRSYKGIDNLLRAVAGCGSLELTLVGDGPLRTEYERLAVRLGATNAQFLGRVDDEQLFRMYAEHDVVALPSTTRAEAFGLVLLEGMLSGCVPVASALPGVRELVAPSGLLVQPGNADELRQALLQLAGDPARIADLSRRSQQRARAMGWESAVLRYESIFRDSVLDVHQRRAIRAFSDPWRTPESALGSVISAFGASWGSLLLFDSSQMRVRAAWGRATMDVVRERAPRIAEYVARTRRPLLLNASQAAMPVRGWMQREDISSALSVPVRTLRGASAVINLAIAADEGGEYTPEHLHRLHRLAS